MLYILGAYLRKEWADLRHQRLFLAVATFTPFVLFICFFLIWSADITVPVRVTDLDEPFVEAMREVRTPSGMPYMRVESGPLSPDPNEYTVHVEVAPGGDRVMVHYGAENENSIKNYINRINMAKSRFLSQRLGYEPIRVQEETVYARDIGTRQFMAVGLLGYALLLSGMIFGGVLMAREFEDRTVKLIQVSPASRVLVLGAKGLVALALTLAAGTIYVTLAGGLLTGAWPANWMLFAGTVGLTALIGVVCGLAVGMALKASVPVFLVALVVNLFTWVSCGGFGHLLMFSDTHQALARLTPYAHAMLLFERSFFASGRAVPGGSVAALAAMLAGSLLILIVAERRILARGR